jgi:hypothetical protein
LYFSPLVSVILEDEALPVVIHRNIRLSNLESATKKNVTFDADVFLETVARWLQELKCKFVLAVPAFPGEIKML